MPFLHLALDRSCGGYHKRVQLACAACFLLALALAGCVSLPAPAPPAAGDATGSPSPSPAQCILPPITPPVMPDEIPSYAQVDPATGLHMTGTVQQIELESYRLKVTGKVDRPLNLTIDQLRCMPRLEGRYTLICPGFFSDEADWAGAPLSHVLELASVQSDASSVNFVSADGYSASLALDQALNGENFLAYEQGSQPLPILHGFPVRAVLPSQLGGKWAKWLVEIRVE